MRFLGAEQQSMRAEILDNLSLNSHLSSPPCVSVDVFHLTKAVVIHFCFGRRRDIAPFRAFPFYELRTPTIPPFCEKLDGELRADCWAVVDVEGKSC